MTYIPQPQQVEGNKTEVTVSDDNAQSLLTHILKEMKKMNLHLMIMTDNDIKNTEIDL